MRISFLITLIIMISAIICATAQYVLLLEKDAVIRRQAADIAELSGRHADVKKAWTTLKEARTEIVRLQREAMRLDTRAQRAEAKCRRALQQTKENEALVREVVQEKAAEIRAQLMKEQVEKPQEACPSEDMPESFSVIRVVVEVETDQPMGESEIVDNMQKMCDVIHTSPVVKKISTLAIAGACLEESGEVVFRVLKSNEEKVPTEAKE